MDPASFSHPAEEAVRPQPSAGGSVIAQPPALSELASPNLPNRDRELPASQASRAPAQANHAAAPHGTSVSTLSEVDALRRQLLQAQKLGSLGVLASSVTHEFNNILTTIINYAKLGLRRRDDASRERALERILLAGQRAAKLTAGLLSYARVRGDRREPCDVVRLIDEVLLLADRDLAKHHVRLQTHFEGRPRAVVNGNQIQQVLLNLIINARQAMSHGGRLLLSARAATESGMVEIAVADTGTGIPPDKLRYIFEPFFTTKAGPDSTGKGGTGLGLSLCRDIIEAHHGRIRVDSTPGKGTTFTVKLPAAPPIPSPAPAPLAGPHESW